MSALRFHMLGTLEGWCGRQPLLLPPTLKSQSLLAYLVVNRAQPQPRARLIGMYWPDHPEPRARRSLTTALWHIRRCLPDGLLLSDPHMVQFSPAADVWLDADQFTSRAGQKDLHSLEAACKFYRGDFLDGFYDDWAIQERYRLQELFIDVLANLMAAQEEAGAQRKALSTALRLLDRDPLYEEAHRLVMRTYCRLGQRNQALEQYRRCQEALYRELGAGAEPEAEITALHTAILNGTFLAEPVHREAEPSTPGSDGHAQPAHAFNPLVDLGFGRMYGRERELACLEERWQEACTGKGGLQLIQGEAGVGKTRLVEEFSLGLGARGTRVLRGRCYEFEKSLPYQPFPDVIRGILPELSPRELQACPGWALAEVARLVPEIAEDLPRAQAANPPDSPDDQAGGDRERLFDGLVRFFAAVAANDPFLIVMDDLHWAGRSCLELLHYLTRHIAGRPILVLGTFRPEALSEHHPLLSLQRDLSSEGLSATVQIQPLPPCDVQTMMVELSGHAGGGAPLAERLYSETGGNPFLLIETVRSLFEEGAIRLAGNAWRVDFARIAREGFPLPSSIQQAIAVRIDRLSAAAREALQYAAVLGQEFDFAALRLMWGRGEEGTLAALDELLRRKLLIESSSSLSRDYSFAHKRIQEVVYADMPRHVLLHRHALAARAIERVYPRQLDDLAGELAFHYLRAREHDNSLAEKAIGYLLAAGDKARELYMLQEAITYYEQALALLQDRPEHERAARTLMKLGLAYHMVLDFARAGEAYQKGFVLWQRAGRTPSTLSTAALPPAPHALRMQWGEPSSLDPGTAFWDREFFVVHQLFSGLVEIGHEMEIVPATARSWEVLDSGRTYRFHLAEDARWSDGRPVTAPDFEFAWKRMLAPETGWQLAGALYIIRGARDYNQGRTPNPDEVAIRAIDDRTLELQLEGPAGYFLNLISSGAPVSRECVQTHGAGWLAPEIFVSNGAFLLEEWQRGQYMTLVRNPDTCCQFSGNVDHLQLQFIPREDWQASLEAYESNRLDLLDITYFPREVAGEVRLSHPEEYLSLPDLGTYFLSFDTRTPPFNNPNVRKAFAHAMNREGLAYDQLGGSVVPATGGFVSLGMPAHSPGIGLEYNPDLARRLLAGAGFPGGRGLPVLNCLLAPLGSAPFVQAHLQRQWADTLGVESRWTIRDPDEYLPSSGEGQLQAAAATTAATAIWGTCYLDPDEYLRLGVSHIKSFTRWEDREYDRLVEEATRTWDREKRYTILQQADRALVESAAIIPLYYTRSHLLVKPWLKRYPTFAASRWFLRHVVIEPH